MPSRSRIVQRYCVRVSRRIGAGGRVVAAASQAAFRAVAANQSKADSRSAPSGASEYSGGISRFFSRFRASRSARGSAANPASRSGSARSRFTPPSGSSPAWQSAQ